jgi:heme oxygenase (mycobilin-producing)
MVVRIVRMHFREEAVPEFLAIFESNKTAIRKFPGCQHLELLKDLSHPTTYTTLSHWKHPDDLEAYRKSELFEGVWVRVKKLFAARTEAFTMVKV